MILDYKNKTTFVTLIFQDAIYFTYQQSVDRPTFMTWYQTTYNDVHCVRLFPENSAYINDAISNVTMGISLDIISLALNYYILYGRW